MFYVHFVRVTKERQERQADMEIGVPEGHRYVHMLYNFLSLMFKLNKLPLTLGNVQVDNDTMCLVGIYRVHQESPALDYQKAKMQHLYVHPINALHIATTSF